MDVNSAAGQAAVSAMTKALANQGVTGQVIGKTLEEMEQMKAQQAQMNDNAIQTAPRGENIGKNLNTIV